MEKVFGCGTDLNGIVQILYTVKKESFSQENDSFCSIYFTIGSSVMRSFAQP